jgi:single-strand DNA-binding protein
VWFGVIAAKRRRAADSDFLENDMSSFNKVLLMGNLTRDPQLKYLPSQTAVVEFGVACNRKFRTANGEDKEEVTFVDCTSFGKQAEVINQYFQKGKPIFIEGRLKFDSWEDKTDGKKRSKLTVVIENFQFVGGRDGGDQPAPRDDGDQREYPRTRQTVGAGAKQRVEGAFSGPALDDSEVPF